MRFCEGCHLGLFAPQYYTKSNRTEPWHQRIQLSMSQRRGLGCPYEGHVAPQRVAQVAKRLLEALAVFCMLFFFWENVGCEAGGLFEWWIYYYYIRHFGWNFMVFSLGKLPTWCSMKLVSNLMQFESPSLRSCECTKIQRHNGLKSQSQGSSFYTWHDWKILYQQLLLQAASTDI